VMVARPSALGTWGRSVALETPEAATGIVATTAIVKPPAINDDNFTRATPIQ
jgi:hypothetical protein